MLSSVTKWLRAMLLAPQTRRDENLEHWWQLPTGPTRQESLWRQLIADLVTPATFSLWHLKIADHRVEKYDGLRPPVVRAVCLTVLVGAFWALRPPLGIWLMLVPGAIQIPLEIWVQTYHGRTAPEPRWWPTRVLRDYTRDHFRTTTLKSVPGFVGIVACPVNIVAVAFAPAVGDYGWLKITALCAAIFYLNSALANSLLAPPNYTEASVMPPIMHAMRPYVPVASLAFVVGIIAASVAWQRWEPSMIPIAYLSASLTLLLGGTVRNHDRVVAAAAAVAREAVLDGRRELGRVMHDDFGPAKAAAEAASRLPGIRTEESLDLRALSAFLTHHSTRVDMTAGLRIDLADLAWQLASPCGLAPGDVICQIDWDADTLRREDHQVAVRACTALISNVVQLLSEVEHASVPKRLELHTFTTGAGHELSYHLAVRDHLPVIPAAAWCQDGDSLTALREWLRDSYIGDLVQEDLGDGSKRIVASWPDRATLTWQESSGS